MPVPTILAKVLQRSHTHTHQAKNVLLSIGVETMCQLVAFTPGLAKMFQRLYKFIESNFVCAVMNEGLSCKLHAQLLVMFATGTAFNDTDLGSVASLHGVQICVVGPHEAHNENASACPKLSKRGFITLCGHTLIIYNCWLQQHLPCALARLYNCAV